MLREDIKNTIVTQILIDFPWIEEVKEDENLRTHELLDSLDMIDLSLSMESEYDLDFISPDDTYKWTTVREIVDFIEDALESKGE